MRPHKAFATDGIVVVGSIPVEFSLIVTTDAVGWKYMTTNIYLACRMSKFFILGEPFC